MTCTRSYITPILPFLFALLCAVQSLRAQTGDPSAPVRLMTDAADRHGTVSVGEGEGEYFNRLLYVKVSHEVDISDPTSLAEHLSTSGLVISRVASFGTDLPLLTGIGTDSYARRLHAEYLLSRLFVVEYQSTHTPDRAAVLLDRHADVLIAEPVPVPTLFGTPEQPDDPLIPEQRQLSMINAEEAWEVTPGDTSVIVGVVDAGVTAKHEDLWDNIAINWGETGTDDEGNARETNGIDDDGNGYVDDWKGVNLTPGDGVPPGETGNGEHGTQVAGYVGATTDNGLGIAGVANQCRFFPLKAARHRSTALVGGYNGILYAAREGFSVVNCSWGQPVASAVEQEIIDLAVDGYDIAIVAAGGNDYEKVRFFPAGYRNVLGVAGINDLRSVTTAWGEHIDVAARAGLTTSDLNKYFDLNSASSYSTPVVSGVVALVRSAFPELSSRQALAHVRNTATPIDNFNLGREGFVGKGLVDAFEAVSTDPFSRPALVIDSIWAVDAAGNRTDSLREGDGGALRMSVTNLLGDATDAWVSARLYTDDSAAFTLLADSIYIGDLPSGGTWISEAGLPISVNGPGRRSIPIRLLFGADEFSNLQYELVPIRRTYVVLEGEKIHLTITGNGKPAIDYAEGEPVGEGVTFMGRQQIYEAGLIVATDSRHILDNVRDDSPAIPNDDFLPVSPSGFPIPVTAAVVDRDGENDHVGLRIGTRGELFDEWPGVMRIGFFVENLSVASIDSLRLALFADWDLDEASDNQLVQQLDIEQLPDSLFPVMARLRSGIVTTAWIALETGRRNEGDRITPLFYAILNGGDPLVIFDGFSDEEKYRTVSNGIGNAASGPGDISLVIGGVIPHLEIGEVDSLFILVEFLEGEGMPVELITYAEDTYGITGVPQGEGTTVRAELTTIVRSDGVEIVAGKALVSISLLDVRGRVVAGDSTLGRGTTLTLTTGTVPSGNYHLVLDYGDRIESVPVRIVR